MSKKLFLLALSVAVVLPAVASAQLAEGIVVDFETDSRFDGLGIDGSVTLDSSSSSTRYNGGVIFDSVFTLEGARAVSGTGMDAELVEATGIYSNIDPGGGSGTYGLGVGGGNFGDSDNEFNFSEGLGEEIDFSLSVEDPTGAANTIVFDKIAFSGLDDGETFTLQSAGFAGKGFAAFTYDSGVGYVESGGVGTFTFTGNGSKQEFELTPTTDVNYDRAVWAEKDSTYTLAFGGGSVNPSSARFAGFTFHAVPEPTFMGLLAASGIGFVVHRRRKKKLNKRESA